MGAILAVCALYALWAHFTDTGNDSGAVDLPAISVSPYAGSVSWQDAIDSVTRSITARQREVARDPDDWGHHLALASAYVARGRLTGNYDDFVLAEQALDDAFDTAPSPAGPHVTTAAFNYLLHRLGPALADLDATENYAIAPRGRDKADIIGMRGDIAFYSGDYHRALEFYHQAETDDPDDATGFRLYNYYAFLGPEAEAARYFRSMAEAPTAGEARSFLAATRGRHELRLGRYDSALESFRAADRLFPGDWRTEALVAQVAALQGNLDMAAAKFEEIAQAHDSPEAMDALAAIYRFEGNGTLSRRWAERAGTIWERRLRQFPEAASAHAAEHELAFGSSARALSLARANWQARGYGDAGILLTWALIANGQIDEARQAIERVLASGWNTPDTHIAAARVYELTGDSEKAETQRQAALGLNPHAFDPQAALLWFAH